MSIDGIRAVTFDAGGTLIEPWPSVGHVYAEIAARHGHGNIAPGELTRRFVDAWRGRKNFSYTRTEWAAIVDESFGNLIPELPSRTFFPELYDHFVRAEAWRIYEDVIPTLATLSGKGLRLGVISNWDERLRPLLEALDLMRHFDVITVSQETGCTKPAREIFQTTADKLGFAPEEILHIGDSFREDVEGACAAGFRALHLVRNRSACGIGEVNTLMRIPL